ncbi:MAG TPA: SIMPL domain-containing protein [Polyangiaceae bacterium]|nr:SIMPL domain-containing protein [Polyangiaceae bacterium]
MTHRNDRIGTLEITGVGRVDVRPDVAVLFLGVVTEGRTAEEASTRNAEKANEVVERLTRLEIPRTDLRTVGLNLYPIYQTQPGTDVSTIIGYRFQNLIMARVPVQLAPKAFDAAVAAGVNESSGITFELRDERPYRQQALELAIKAAQLEAETLSRAMGVTLRGPRSAQVVEGGGPLRIVSERLAARAPTPILPGTMTVTAEVRLVFEYAG